MAHRWTCPELACQRLDQEKKRHPTKKAAYKIVAEELGIPWKTVQTWDIRTSNEARKGIRKRQKSKFELLEDRFRSIYRLLATMPDFRENHPGVFREMHELTIELDGGKKSINFAERPKCFKGELKALWNCMFLFDCFAADLEEYLFDSVDKVNRESKRKRK
jgi:hypothetical protein